jgi:adenylosuccinate lyase
MRTTSSFSEELINDEVVKNYLDDDEIQKLLTPENYIGTSEQKIEVVLSWINSVLR